MSPPYVLVLDDDPWHVTWISDVADNFGLGCKIVSTYDEAKAALIETTPVIVVVDIRIGDVSEEPLGATLKHADAAWVGLRFLRFVRVECGNSKVPIFVYTGLDREELQRIVEGSYSGRFFTKFDSQAFDAALNAEMSRITRH